MNIFKHISKPNKFYSNLFLFIALFMLVFVVPVFPPGNQDFLKDILFSGLFLLGVYSLDNIGKSILTVAIIAFITQWIARILNADILMVISDITNILFLQVIIIRLIIQIARSKEVDSHVIFESINGYLFMGLFYSIWVAMLFKFLPGSLNGLDPETSTFHDILYFTYVTLTTLGYGDITPATSEAKSLAILISTSGQLYVAIIIAMLVGKYAGQGK